MSIILFGGGDGGGLLIGPNGVRPIPPFDPGIRLQLRGVSALLQAAQRLSSVKDQRQLGGLVTKVANLAIEQVEAVIGPLQGDNSLVYQDDDGGFTCGSTGKPPIPFPWPPSTIPSLGDLIANGVLEDDLLDFMQAARGKGVKINRLLEDPAAAASELGVTLSTRTVEDLKRLAPGRLDSIQNPDDREVVEFFHKVAEDGRFLQTWATRPSEVAKALGVKLSPAAIDRLVAGGGSTILDPGAVMNPVAIAVVVGVVIMLVDDVAGRARLGIKDRTGVAKF